MLRPGEVLQLWESSRGSREQAEWTTFLNLLRDNDVRLHVTSHHRLYDLSNPRDRRTLDEDGVDSAYESAKTSMRIKRHTAANAAKGRPHGRVPFGYRRIYDPNTGRLVSQVPKDGEAEARSSRAGRPARSPPSSPRTGSTAGPACRSARTVATGGSRVPAPPDRCPLNPDDRGLVTAIIPGQRASIGLSGAVSSSYSRIRV